MKVYSQGDQAIVVSLRGQVTPNATQRLLVLKHYLDEQNIPFITEIVPTETDMLISYDAQMMMKQLDITSPFLYMKDFILGIDLSEEKWKKQRRCVKVPMYYGGEYGPHLKGILEELELTEESFVHYHTSSDYFVSMMGYSPGFPYLSGVDPKIIVNHTASEKRFIPAGSVILENNKCGITTIDTYEDWLVIGWTPLQLFYSSKEDFAHISLGDYVKFDALQEGRDM
ncbi:carboxyltransferase domain-containing protein [Staphylococcus sp. IVB6246]|uniref:carboxyltransferase domain-containing protein n=1 Tax=Staphylococcus sp. IVB6246 TaxID=2989772 RepID=UPI0021D3723A|nr:carboxyltransferase domain-containing protein [Staphylococcus sp. IVB6246]UXR69965.1 carboxyltransferase domain-containing protein [Staphylococcus sp. IVB6246]